MAADYAVYMSALLTLWSVARQYKLPARRERFAPPPRQPSPRMTLVSP
jgi:hypothetical protein